MGWSDVEFWRRFMAASQNTKIKWLMGLYFLKPVSGVEEEF